MFTMEADLSTQQATTLRLDMNTTKYFIGSSSSSSQADYTRKDSITTKQQVTVTIPIEDTTDTGSELSSSPIVTSDESTLTKLELTTESRVEHSAIVNVTSNNCQGITF